MGQPEKRKEAAPTMIIIFLRSRSVGAVSQTNGTAPVAERRKPMPSRRESRLAYLLLNHSGNATS